MDILKKNLLLDDFRKYVSEYDFGLIKPTSLVVHHTWKPTKSDWRGESTLEGIERYYEGKGWSAGPHLFIAEDGIWLFTPMNEVGIHAGEGNATWTRLGHEHTGFHGPVGAKLKSYSLGIEVVGDYDLEKWSGETLKNALGVIKILMSLLSIPTESLYFHRDFPSAKKSCPGLAIQKDWLVAELSKLASDGNKIVAPAGTVSSWAKDGWDWAQGFSLDNSVLPNQMVDAEWVFAILKKYHDLTN